METIPELPEVEAQAHHLRFDPPHTSLAGLEITGAARHGKFLDLDVSGLHLVVHLARGGWLHWLAGWSPDSSGPTAAPTR